VSGERVHGSISRDGAEHARFRATRTFGSLDGLRCASIVAVVWHHARPETPGWLPALHNGFLGVDLFFVISGFLITTLLLRERDARGAISLPRFYARRSLRIFPAYYGLLAALALVLGLVATGANMRAPFFRELPFYATYTSNWIVCTTFLGISWSLATEEQFYVFWPPVERYARRAALPLLALLLLVSQAVNYRLLDGALARAGLRYDELPILQATFTPLLLGVATAHALHRATPFAFAARLLGGRAAAPLALLLVLAAASIPGSLTGTPRLAVQLAMTLLVGACVIREDHALSRILRWRPIRHVGAISYGIYLYHLPAMMPVTALLASIPAAPSGARFVLTLAASIGIADLSLRFFERPFLRLKGRLV
jgi:peptidoglycan/LPS O-acetylase OafA/YrhL